MTKFCASNTPCLLAIILMLLPGHVAGQSAEEVPEMEALWHRLLALSLEHTTEAKEDIVRVGEEAPEPEIRKLAEVLLEEWDLDRASSRLQRPALLEKPEINWPGEKEVKDYPPIFILRIAVNADGLVEDIKLSKGSKGEVFERIVDELRLARFRPALVEGKYVPRELDLLVSFHLD